MGDYVNPKIDFVFRKLFGSEENKDILISLINSIVGPSIHVTDLTIKNPYNFEEYLESKSSILDIKAMDQNGIWYDIEMQVAGQTVYGQRATYYVSKVFVDQLAKGDPFSVLNKTIGIHLVDFEYFSDARYVRHLVFKDAETNEYHESLGYLELYFIEMNKAARYAGDLSNSLNRWIKFLNDATIFDKQTVPDAIASDAEIARALAKLEVMGLTQNEREIYESEVKANMVEVAELEYAKQYAMNQGKIEGKIEGLVQGKIEGKEELVLRQISRRVGDFPLDLAQKLDRLTENQLDDLGEALLDFTTYTDVETWLADHSVE